jgi:hypothetical protein
MSHNGFEALFRLRSPGIDKILSALHAEQRLPHGGVRFVNRERVQFILDCPKALRLGLELRGGGALVARSREDITPRPNPNRTESELGALTFAAVAGLELGLDDDQLLLAVAGGVAAPAGVDGRDPSGAAELRAAWRLWRGSPSVGLYVEPRVTAYFGGLPGDFAFGGALSLKLRLHWLDVGVYGGGFGGASGRVRTSPATAAQEDLAGVGGGLAVGFAPALLHW